MDTATRKVIQGMYHTIATHGFAQYEWQDDSGGVDLEAAMAMNWRDKDFTIPSKVRNALGFSTFQALLDWNDTPGRTKGEVLDLLTKAIKEYGSHEG